MRADKSLKPFEIRLYRHYRIVHGVRIALAFVLTFVLVRLLNVPEGTWPLIVLTPKSWTVKHEAHRSGFDIQLDSDLLISG